MTSAIARHIIVRGRVQGVFFRAWTVETARALDLTGWVRNRRDGSVEIVARGPEPAIIELIRCCHEGPMRARVDEVSVDEVGVVDAEGFEQRDTV
jgi:acylphosphatase